MKKLRCVAYRYEDGYIAECLELGLIAQGDTLSEAKETLERHIVSHFKNVAELLESGERVIDLPVRHYLWRRFWWDVRYHTFVWRRRVAELLWVPPLKALARNPGHA